MAINEESLSFTIDSRLLEELGENLVERNHVALAELIKNCYDADATEVNLKFINSRQKQDTTSEIRVTDDGVGMTPEEIDKKWMRLATTDKIRNPTTEKFGREKQGQKGIGRFATRRLANRLRLVSTAYDDKNGEYVRTTVKFAWSDFERETDLENIPVPAETERLDEAETGVMLRLLDLRDQWGQRDFNTLRRNVITLSIVQPEQREGYEEDPGFEIEFDAPEFDKGQGTLLEQFHEAGWGCLEGRITEDGEVELSLDAKLIGEQSFSLSKSAEGLEDSDFKISFVPRSTKEHFRDPQTLSLQRAREIMDKQAGIRVYKGGFRVYPYGGSQNDWLNIGEDYSRRDKPPADEFRNLKNRMKFHQPFERTMLVFPNNRNLVGRVNLDQGVDLEETASREGFLQSGAFKRLKEIMQLSLQWLTLQYSHYKAVKKEQELEEEVSRLEEEVSEDDTTDASAKNDPSNRGSATRSASGSQSSSVDQALTVLQTVSENAAESVPDEDRELSDEAVDTATNVIQDSIDRQEREIDFLRSAFSVNQLVFGFSHELRSMINQLDSSAKHIENSLEDLPSGQRDRFETISGDLRQMRKRFEEQLNLFGIFAQSGDDMEEVRNRVKPVAEDVIDGGRYVAERHQVQVSNDVPALLGTPRMYESELYSILINLFTNSLKAVIAADGERKISIDGENTEDGMVVRVKDSGVGIPAGQEEQFFTPLVSDPSNNLYSELERNIEGGLSEDLGSGTGLGLGIVRDIAKKHGGSAEFVDLEDWETCVEVTLSE